jgi:hypothetical protein
LRLDDADVAAFIERLDAEQRRFLAAADEAQRLLVDLNPLAEIVAEQLRLLRRVLDAQRAIIRRCAEAHAAVGELEATASFNVDQIRAHRDATCNALLIGADTEAPGPSYRKAVGADALLERVEDQLANMPWRDDGEDDDTLAERWDRLLDRAWRQENQRCLSALVTAQVDAEIRVHEERVAARNALAEARRASVRPGSERVSRTTLLASPLFAGLDGVEDDWLEGYIDGLLEELQDDDSEPIVVRPSDDELAGALDLSPGYLEVDGRRIEDEAFARFWAIAGVRRPRRSHRPAWAVRTLVPSIGLITGALSWLAR